MHPFPSPGSSLTLAARTMPTLALSALGLLLIVYALMLAYALHRDGQLVRVRFWPLFGLILLIASLTYCVWPFSLLHSLFSLITAPVAPI